MEYRHDRRGMAYIIWTDAEIFQLIQVWSKEGIQEQLKGAQRNKHIYGLGYLWNTKYRGTVLYKSKKALATRPDTQPPVVLDTLDNSTINTDTDSTAKLLVSNEEHGVIDGNNGEGHSITSG